MPNGFKSLSRPMKFFFAALLISSLGLGFSDVILSNYFKDAYNVTTVQRGFLEIPREMPGFLCLIIMSSLSFLSDVKKMILAHILIVFGSLVFGFFTPPFYVMSIFLFIFSTGVHLTMPLQDSIGLALAEPDKVGARMGQFAAVRTFATMASGIVVSLGFRYNWFSFFSEIKVTFLVSAAFLVYSFAMYLVLNKQAGEISSLRRASSGQKLVFKKKYAIYYALSLSKGFHNQILYVYAPWILIELMEKKADTISFLNVGGALAGVLILPLVGKLIDRVGTKKLLMAESLCFFLVYAAYAYISRALNTGGAVKTEILVMIFVGGIYIVERMLSLMAMVRSVYIKSLISDPNELTPVLATGLSLDHVISVSFAFLGGLIWSNWGPEYVFYIAGASCVITLILSSFIKSRAAEVSSDA